MKRITLFFIALCCGFAVLAQDATISGKVIDKTTNTGVAYCNILLQETHTGTVCNEEGEFVLHVSAADLNGHLKVSHIGYATDTIALSKLTGAKAVITLTPKPGLLAEVMVKPLDPVELVKQAFNNVKDNYSQRPLRMQGFYREYIQEDDRTVELSEALLGVYLSAYSGNKSDVQLKLLKGRKSSDSTASKSGSYIYIGGVPHSLLEADAVHELNEFDRDEFIRSSDMKLDGIRDFDDLQLYEISFDQKDNVKKALYKGRLFIDTRSMAIVSMDYSISPKGLPYFRLLKGASRMAASMAKIGIDLLDEHFMINYQRTGNTWFLNNAVATYEFHFTKGGSAAKSVDVKLFVGSELLINGIDENNGAPFAKSEQLQYKGPFSKKITDYDPLFWMGNNYISPSTRIKAMAEKLKDIK